MLTKRILALAATAVTALVIVSGTTGTAFAATAKAQPSTVQPAYRTHCIPGVTCPVL